MRSATPRSPPASSRISIPTEAPSWRTASGKERFSIRIRKVMAVPPASQPKHLKLCRSAFTMNEGVFSAWKGQSPLWLRPDGLRLTKRQTRATMSTRSRTSRIVSSGISPTDSPPSGLARHPPLLLQRTLTGSGGLLLPPHARLVVVLAALQLAQDPRLLALLLEALHRDLEGLVVAELDHGHAGAVLLEAGTRRAYRVRSGGGGESGPAGAGGEGG